MKLVAEIIGGVAIVVAALIYQQKTERRLLLYKGIADTLWIAHYALLGGYTGAAISTVALIRGIVLYCNERRGIKSKKVLWIFLIASGICTAITWRGVMSIFPAVASLLAVVCFWLGKPKVLRIMSFPISACMMTYGIYNGSIAVIVNESLTMVSSSLALITQRKK